MPQAWREAATAALASVILAAVILTAALMLLAGQSYGRTLYPGQWAQYSPEERTWFKAMKSPNGVPCCDVADGHRTTWRSGPVDTEHSGYLVPIQFEAPPIVHDDESEAIGQLPNETPTPPEPTWISVPPEAVVNDPRNPNPTGDAIVWYVMQRGLEKVHIRCFVVGSSG
jgi:hypothetical protein